MNLDQNATASINCPRCASVNPTVARFCGVCGMPLQVASMSSPAFMPGPASVPPPTPSSFRVGAGSFLGSGTPQQVIVNADPYAAFAAAVQAIERAGGQLQSQSPPQSARFVVGKRSFWGTGLVKVRYDGELVVSPVGPQQCAIRVTLKMQSGSVTTMIGLCVATLLFGLILYAQLGVLLGIVGAVWCYWLTSSRIPRDLTNRLLGGVPSTVSSAVAPAPSGTAPLPTTGARPQAANRNGTQPPSPFEQLKQLAELRQLGVLTTAEFEARKAALLEQL